MLGRIEDSLQQVKSARELDPLSIANTSLAYRTYYNEHNYGKAIEVCRNALDVDPNFVYAHQRLIAIYERKGELDKAIEEWRTGNFAGENSEDLARQVNSLHKAYAEKGARGYWLQKLELLRAEPKSRVAIPIIVTYARLGNKDEAFRRFEKAIERPLPHFLCFIRSSPHLAPPPSHPPYSRPPRPL